VLLLETLRWGDEVIDPSAMDVPKKTAKTAGVSEKELSMAVKLIEEMSSEFEPEQYKDSFREDIEALVERKVKAGRTHVIEDAHVPRPERLPSGVVDLTELLKNSLRKNTAALPAPKKSAAKKPAKASKATKATKKRARASA
jgi:DNA end-binding protein Ku